MTDKVQTNSGDQKEKAIAQALINANIEAEKIIDEANAKAKAIEQDAEDAAKKMLKSSNEKAREIENSAAINANQMMEEARIQSVQITTVTKEKLHEMISETTKAYNSTSERYSTLVEFISSQKSSLVDDLSAMLEMVKELKIENVISSSAQGTFQSSSDEIDKYAEKSMDTISTQSAKMIQSNQNLINSGPHQVKVNTLNAEPVKTDQPKIKVKNQQQTVKVNMAQSADQQSIIPEESNAINTFADILGVDSETASKIASSITDDKLKDIINNANKK